MRERLIRLAIKYQGDYQKILNAIQTNEKEDESIELVDAITLLDDDYPKQLFDLTYPPFVLFYKGNKELLKNRLVSIVGSREITDYGKRMTIEITKLLSKSYTTVSGLAKGADALVHQYSSDTIGILGSGIDYCYPKCNEELYNYMCQHQLVLSEYPSLVVPDKKHFPFRNRIIAALSDKIIVTQASIHSGTMLTVNEGLDINRQIYVVPYHLDEIEGQGCNNLIQSGANMILSVQCKKGVDIYEQIDKNRKIGE